MKNKILKILDILIYAFAVIGFLLVAGYFAVKFGFTNTKGIIDNQNSNFLNPNEISKQIVFSWNQTQEWNTFKEAVVKDKDVIKKVEYETGMNSRLIVSILTVEQLRLFNSERESFKKFFSPLKILGVQSKFSWGVMGIKEDTAKKVENNLKDVKSPFYLGKENENILDFKTEDESKERYERLTDPHDRYYQYFYTAILLKEILSQWENAGFDISSRPEVLATLYNIGFLNSKPNESPQSGGAEIKIGENVYSFGGLAREFYYSNELIDVFPR